MLTIARLRTMTLDEALDWACSWNYADPNRMRAVWLQRDSLPADLAIVEPLDAIERTTHYHTGGRLLHPYSRVRSVGDRLQNMALLMAPVGSFKNPNRTPHEDD